MLNIIKNQPLEISAKIDDDEIVKREEYQEIVKAIQTIAKYSDSFVISGYAKSDEFAFTYQDASFSQRHSNMRDKIAKEKGEKEAAEKYRGADMSSNITNLLMYLGGHYGIDPKVVLHTIRAAFELMDNLGNDAIADLNSKLKNAKSFDEGLNIARGALTREDGSLLGEEDSAVKVIGVKKDGGIDGLKPLIKALSRSLGATVLVGAIRMDENGDIDDAGPTNFSGVCFQEDVGEIAKRTDLDLNQVKTALVGTLCTGVFAKLKKEYGLKDGFFERFMKKENL